MPRPASLRLSFALGLMLALVSLPVRAQTADTDCLTCHSQKDLKSPSGRSLFVDEARHKTGAHADLPCIACHTDITGYPHPERIGQVSCAACHAEQATDVPKSIHAALGPESCAACHGDAHSARAASKLTPQLCASCHAAEAKDFAASVHGRALASGDAQAPQCWTCHGPVHKILTAQDPASPVAKKNLPDTCGTCHANPDFLSRHQIPFAHPVEAYKLSVHGRAVAAGDEHAPSCSDCHASHAIYSARDPRSKINHWNVPATCGSCHVEIAKTYGQSVHGQAVAHSAPDAPVCTDCHGEHVILAPSEPQSSVNPARISSVTCGRCHGDQRLNARYNLPADRLPTFADSYHGLAATSGSQSVANCASCHGVHNIFRSSDPRSTVYPANLARTCGACHTGAGENFAIGKVHVVADTAAEHPVVRGIRWIYWVLIPLAVGFMFFHHLLDFLRKLLHPAERVSGGEEVARMNRHFRAAHWLTVVSFPLLVITGFALKFPTAWWARPMLVWEGRFAFRGTVHRIAAVVLLSSLAYHVAHLILVRRDRPFLRYMVPSLRDLLDLRDMILFNLGLISTRPVFGKFSYVEKIEYLAYLWGTMVMAATGFILWFDNFALRHFPKWVSDAATALHYYEAILATLAILIWHMYTVVFDPDVYPMDRAWITGKTSADHLRHTRPEYYAELIKQEQARQQPAISKLPDNAPGQSGKGTQAGKPAPDNPPEDPSK